MTDFPLHVEYLDSVNKHFRHLTRYVKIEITEKLIGQEIGDPPP